jgi:hypothetical protein
MALHLPLHQNKNENIGLRLACQAGRCCEKASASALASVFSKTDPAFAQRIKPVFFLSSYLTRSFPLISPRGPTSGCSTAHLPGAWLCLSELSVVKSNLDFRCADDAVVRGNDSLPATRNPLLSFV